MLRILVKLLFFVIVFMMLDRAIFAAAMYIRDHRGYHEGINLIYYPKWDAQIVFFGNSRTAHNYDMQRIEEITKQTAYNFGIDGIGLQQSVFMIEELLRNNHHPKVIVLQADPLFLTRGYGVMSINPFREYLATEPPNDVLWAVHPATLSQRMGEWSNAWLARTASLPNRLPDMWVEYSPSGGPPPDPKPRRANAGTFAYTAYHGSVLYDVDHRYKGNDAVENGFSLDPTQNVLYERAVELAEAAGAKLLLAQSPRYGIDIAYPEKTIKGPSDAIFCGLAQRSDNVLYARMTHVGDDDPDVYFDQIHFNIDGAREMSDAVAPLINELLRGARPEPCVLR